MQQCYKLVSVFCRGVPCFFLKSFFEGKQELLIFAVDNLNHHIKNRNTYETIGHLLCGAGRRAEYEGAGAGSQ